MKRRFFKKKAIATIVPKFQIKPDYKEKVRLQSYLGKKGYTIPKVVLEAEDLSQIKETLLLKPFVPGPQQKEETAFPVYRENTAKIYLPRFFGIERYGLPDRSELGTGESIDCPFTKELRDYQNNIVNIYLDHVKKPIYTGATRNGSGAILEVPCGRGKCLGKDTPVLMYDGSIKLVQNIVVGDLLMGDDDMPRTVLTLARGREMMYRISDCSTKNSYIVNKSHILSLKKMITKQVYDIEVTDYLQLNFLEKNELYGYRIKNDDFAQLYAISVIPLQIDDYYGFEIDGNRRFVLGDYTVTHNTVMALKIISEIQKKTLILVHKEFLMNQWIERISEFLPSARVGKIQGQTQDIEGKDIVIGMIQTMYNRDFPAEFFDPFGLTVIDEVHRIGSEEFSKTLFKTVTPNMLGISATVERKDRLTKLLYMFIGPKIYSEDRKDDDVVQVRGIEFGSNDPDYSTMEYDFRGMPKYSTMITKICAFGPRSDFIVRLLDDLLKENPENQIMVLAHNRSLLSYLFDAIQHKIGEQRGSVGYYIGGMKEKDLKITEGKRIVLATYAMAAEALDIKTLSTLVMATPKTDIEQSVGRILRAKHASPIVVDIIDSHDLFKNQWRSRKTFYKKCDYRILYTNSTKYRGFLNPDGSEPIDLTKDTNWKVEYEPKKKEEVCHKEPIVAKCAIDIPEGFE
jgi:Hom_end-associated Hint/Type III restriction enzyme, res subunit